MNLTAIVLVVLAQHVHHRGPPLYVEPITVAPPVRPVTDNEATHILAAPVVVQIPPATPVSIESWWDAHPWWPFVALLMVWVAVAAYRGRRERLSLPGRRVSNDEYGSELPDGHCGPPRPTIAQWRAMEALADGVPIPLAHRSKADCRTLYIDTVRAQVRRMIGRPDIRCVLVPAAPLETRWRAWIGTTDWATANPDLRATGRTEGQALKRLLAAYQAFGSNWMGFAVERERPELARSEPSLTERLCLETPALQDHQASDDALLRGELSSRSGTHGP